jgi:glycosyltransferase involved in cell wall biosynthesis
VARHDVVEGPQVTFAGFVGGHDLTALMGASDCYVVPSIYEPFGMVALEAAAAGTRWRWPGPAASPRSWSTA